MVAVNSFSIFKYHIQEKIVLYIHNLYSKVDENYFRLITLNLIKYVISIILLTK